MSNNLKLAIHECSYIDSFSDDKPDIFPFLKEIGFSTVEFSVLGNYSEKRALYLKEHLDISGLSAACCTCLPDSAGFATNDPEQTKSGIDYLKKCVDFCSTIGASTLSGILYSPWGCSDMDINKSLKCERAAIALREAADYAAQFGVTFCLEVLNRYESDYINTLNEGKQFLSIVDRKNVKLLADVFHMNIEEANIPAAILENADSIGNIHISENNRDYPGYGAMDWQKITSSIKESSYRGNITYECSVKQGTEVGNAFNIWHSYSTEQDFLDRLKTSAQTILSLI